MRDEGVVAGIVAVFVKEMCGAVVSSQWNYPGGLLAWNFDVVVVVAGVVVLN